MTSSPVLCSSQSGRCAPGEREVERQRGGAQGRRQPAHQEARRLAVRRVQVRAHEQQAEGDAGELRPPDGLVRRSDRLVLLPPDRLVVGRRDRQGHHEGGHAQPGEPLAVVVVDGHRQHTAQQLDLLKARGCGLPVRGGITQRMRRRSRFAEPAHHVRQIDDGRQPGHPVVDGVHGLEKERLRPVLRHGTLNERGYGLGAAASHQGHRAEQAPAGRQHPAGSPVWPGRCSLRARRRTVRPGCSGRRPVGRSLRRPPREARAAARSMVSGRV